MIGKLDIFKYNFVYGKRLVFEEKFGKINVIILYVLKIYFNLMFN